LGDGDALGGQRLGEFDLTAHGLAGDEIDDLLLPGGLRQRRGVRRGGTVRLGHHRSSRWVMRAFCAWRRFSASSKTTEAGPSMTSAVTSLPREAGRQWRKTGSLPASMSSWLTWNGMNGDDSSSRRAASWPIDTQVSVTRTSAPRAAAFGSSVTVSDPPVWVARASASAITAGTGWWPAGAAMRTCMPALTPPSA